MIHIIVTLIFLLGIVVATILGFGFFWQWYYRSPTSEDEIHYFRTKDGWRLALHRYRPKGEAIGLPVILCHGLGSNRYTFELPAAPSAAKYLRDQGRDGRLAARRLGRLRQAQSIQQGLAPGSSGLHQYLAVEIDTNEGNGEISAVGNGMLARLAGRREIEVIPGCAFPLSHVLVESEGRLAPVVAGEARVVDVAVRTQAVRAHQNHVL